MKYVVVIIPLQHCFLATELSQALKDVFTVKTMSLSVEVTRTEVNKLEAIVAS